MWTAKLRIKHDCTIGNRCEKFGCVSYSILLGNWRERNSEYVSGRHRIEGEAKAVRKFLQDIKKDKNISGLEVSGNTVFFVEKGRIPSSFHNQKIVFTKPVFVDTHGYESWEIASHERKALLEFLERLRKEHYRCAELLQLKNIKVSNIYFPPLAPDLTEKQKKAFELAVEEGYYDIPKRTELKKLAKIMEVSLATYQEHLKRAEAKIIPKIKMG